MAIIRNGKVYRNIQEQVLKNTEDIDDLNHRTPTGDKFYTEEETDELLDKKQNTLVSSGDNQNIKTINGQSILGSGDIDIVGLIYPVGSIYMSVNSTSPASLFGGTWEQLKDRFLLSAGDTYTNGATGGNSTHNHTLNNGYAKFNVRTTGSSYADQIIVDSYAPNLRCEDANQYTSFDEWTVTGGIALGGTTDSSSSLPPYLVVYMWKRTA